MQQPHRSSIRSTRKIRVEYFHNAIIGFSVEIQFQARHKQMMMKRKLQFRNSDKNKQATAL